MRADRLRVRVKTAKPGALIVFDAWGPAWTATVNGQPSPIMRAFVAMRAVPIARGTSEIEIDYRPPWFWPLAMISFFSVLLSIAIGFQCMRSSSTTIINEVT